MLYKPRDRPPKGINYPIESPFNEALFLIGLTAAFLVATYFIIGVLIDAGAQHITLHKETQYFQKDFITNPDPQQESLQKLANRLWKNFPESNQTPLRTEIKKSKDLNAFMMIGGNLTVTQGLVEQLQIENELAFVICHEIGHFYNRDIIHGMGRRLGLAMMLSSLGLSDSMDIIGIGAQTLSLAFNRKQESRADAFALDCINNQYGHVKGFDGFFKLILKKEKLPKASRKVLSFSTTHPITEDRILELNKLIKEKKINVEAKLTH